MFNRKPIVALSLATALVGGALTSPASADSDEESYPVLLTEETAAVTAGTSVWLNVMWASVGDMEDFRVTVKANSGADVEYSVTTGDHAGPMNGYQMLDNEADFTAVRLTVPEDTKKDEVKLEFKTSWTTPDGKSEKQNFKIKVPVVHHTGDDWQLVGDNGPAVNGWVEMKVAGFAPSSDDIQFEVLDDAGTSPYLPQITWTGPHNDGDLVTGETDMVRFYVEPGSVSPGDHTITFATSWVRNNEAKTKNVSFTFTAS